MAAKNIIVRDRFIYDSLLISLKSDTIYITLFHQKWVRILMNGSGSGRRWSTQRQVFLDYSRVQSGIEQNIGHEIALMRTVTLFVSY